MSNDQWDKVWDIFHALAQCEPEKQEQRLTELCGDDDELAAEVRSLIDAHQGKSGPLDQELGQLASDALTGISLEQIGPYRVIEKIGAGGMGDVYLCELRESDFHQKVAIKVAAGTRYSAELEQRFFNERQILSDLNHPMIARLFSCGTTDEGIPYLVMEYVAGDDVLSHCAKLRLSIDQRLDIFSKICSAVQHAHQNLVIHRDIKPANIIMTAAGEPKLLDFGVAKLLGGAGGEEATTAIFASPNYASPEQLSGEPMTTTSDIYSLGVLLYQLICGSLPHDVSGLAWSQVVEQIRGTPPQKPSQNMAPDMQAQLGTRAIHRDLDAICICALATLRENRYQSLQSLIADLRCLKTGLPVSARNGGGRYRIGRFVKRNPLGVGLFASFIIFLIAVSVAMTRQAFDLRRALASQKVEMRKSEQVATFLTRLFKVSDPLLAKDPDISALTLLDRAADRIDTELDDDPGVKSALLVTLGKVYCHLGVASPCEKLLRQGIALSEATDGPFSRESASGRIAMSQHLLASGKYQEAAAILEEFLNAQGVENALVAYKRGSMLVRLGGIYGSLGRLDDGLQRVDEGLELILADESIPADVSAGAYINLGGLYWRKADYKAASAAYYKAHEIYVSVYGKDHHNTMQSTSALGIVLLRQGELAQAEPFFLQVVRYRVKTLGDGHLLTAEAKNRLGVLYYEMGRFDESEQMLLEALAAREAALEWSSPLISHSINNLSLTLFQQRKQSQAETLLRRALKIDQQASGDGSGGSAGTLNNLGLVLFDMGDFAQAQDFFSRACKRTSELLGESHLSMGFCLTNLGRARLMQGESDAAGKDIRRALEIRRSKLKDDHPMIGATLAALGEWQMSRKQYGDAVNSLESAVAIRGEKLPANDWRTAEAAGLLSYTQFLAADDDFLLDDLDAAYAILTSSLGTEHWRTQLVAARLQEVRLAANGQSKR